MTPPHYPSESSDGFRSRPVRAIQSDRQLKRIAHDLTLGSIERWRELRPGLSPLIDAETMREYRTLLAPTISARPFLHELGFVRCSEGYILRFEGCPPRRFPMTNTLSAFWQSQGLVSADYERLYMAPPEKA